ncbi:MULTISPECIES: HD-GYP domain-containing protein [unclassified Paenibacillus]|uniref:HD-GYP domain-containing protein n=1 Tax=unclassified Paenibacillus TaxID=185978 RepID=UPI0024076999|nr:MULTISPECIES: HD-GYP domain-containing protein [unclassified Paenibacillus]MDF9841829.1 HD-GYP domain-containing protein (c-di-GMP phosphodiesterase class II) [Paenibacillus sp. PastF-2]MDF9848490.1 HD-GYP domain-containing protein (c-di-GMP phosphodiesterase class II) [Paenibacillus sp. PastM-2]MDF9854989.1 HD-GYP domain-containing protein (c-di-GMP phosphodiesterase class II) [Paenibacillus sp. PastF-1]MDH6480258.1 HD-GYP domain-containing protein (c-di-GMP phosphodiesterase class II) [Pae
MRLVSVNRLQSGMKLGKKIYNDEGLVLLADGVELSDALIKRLARIDIGYVYIEDANTDDVVITTLLHDETRNQALKVIRSQFQEMSSMSGITKGFYHLDKKFSKVMDSILDDMSSQEDPMIMLADMHTADNYLYVHSLNVCLYTLVLGIAYGYSKEELRVLGLGSLLHDIGKTQIPVKIVQKPGMLSDEEFRHMQAHTEIGYRILKDEPNIPLLAAHCALQHHERINGTGYPRGLTGPQIHEYAKWLGVADSYDAMTSNRIYKKAMLPHQAVEALYVGSGTLYEQKQLELFRDRVAIYPLGLTVKLSTGESGIVVKIDPSIPHRPVVRVITGQEGEPVTPYEIDLGTALSVVISDVSDDGEQTKST